MNKNILKVTSMAALSLMLLTACSAKNESVTAPDPTVNQTELPVSTPTETNSAEPTAIAPTTQPTQGNEKPTTKPLPKPPVKPTQLPSIPDGSDKIDPNSINEVTDSASNYFAELISNSSLRTKSNALLDALPGDDMKSHASLRAKLEALKAEASMLNYAVSFKDLDVKNPDKVFKGLSSTVKSGFEFTKEDLANIALASDFINLVPASGELDMSDSVSMINANMAKIDLTKIKVSGKKLSADNFPRGKSILTFVADGKTWKLNLASTYF